VFNRTIAYRDKKVVSVFVRFSCAASTFPMLKRFVISVPHLWLIVFSSRADALHQLWTWATTSNPVQTDLGCENRPAQAPYETTGPPRRRDGALLRASMLSAFALFMRHALLLLWQLAMHSRHFYCPFTCQCTARAPDDGAAVLDHVSATRLMPGEAFLAIQAC
jgi:hypothetical protein